MDQLIAFAFLATMLVSCGQSSNSSGGSKNQNPVVTEDFVDLNAIPAEYDLRGDDITLDLQDVSQLRIDLAGFKDDFRISYSTLREQARLVTHHVSKNSTRVDGLNVRHNARSISVTPMARSYACSISVTNRIITDLEGTCYVRVELIMPMNARIEVYNAGSLLTERFVPISIMELMEQLSRSSGDEARMQHVVAFKTSHEQTRSRLALSSEELDRILATFVFDRFSPLEALQRYVFDRENLPGIIERRFSYFDRERALRIVGR